MHKDKLVLRDLNKKNEYRMGSITCKLINLTKG